MPELLYSRQIQNIIAVVLYYNKKAMKLKISTPAKVIYQGEIEKISIPTETENLKVMDGHAPMVTSVKPGIIKLWPMEDHVKVGNEMYISTSKGMVFIDGKIVRIVSAEATISPESENILLQNKKTFEDKIRRLKTE
jgi:F0F1-type ATP synthase epsilon subunit